MSTYRERVPRGTARAAVLRTIAGRERRSHLSAPRVPTVGIDIGGTKVMAGVVDPDGTIVERLRTETPDKSKSPKVVEDVITELVLDLSDRHDVHAVGIGAAGWVDADRSRVLFAPHLAWRNEPLREALAARLVVPVLVDNDANAAAWGEWRFGAGRGEEHLVMITLGTGIGGAILEDGSVKRGRYGVAGEFGHMQVVPGGHRCPCGNRGCWEQYSSGNALVREARELAAADSPVAQRILEVVEGRIEDITGPMVTALAREGDPMCVELLEEMGRWLGVGLANLAAALDPSCFVIGGGVSEADDLLIHPAREAYRRQLTGRGYRPEARIVRAELGADAGMVGAADMARLVARRFVRANRRRAERVHRAGWITSAPTPAGGAPREDTPARGNDRASGSGTAPGSRPGPGASGGAGAGRGDRR
ncbi:ROK family glucokinase [Streptomyces sp. ST2-7A]|uniref:ROK family glucokinase n=1 Tax=Streptomyces sp. ST2-7A TaxID=2907214 RepID=UPI001F3724D2|nr:ROK family glucokinase [Streptomyces sp. ST2-7A]MCE7082083.1 ROK family glucokinase [Streptomyces sp. ST2-7A]